MYFLSFMTINITVGNHVLLTLNSFSFLYTQGEFKAYSLMIILIYTQQIFVSIYLLEKVVHTRLIMY